MISYKEYKSKSQTVSFIIELLLWTKQIIRIHRLRQRLEGESRLSQKVCHQHSFSVGLACNQQFIPKVFATSLTSLPCCFSPFFFHWLIPLIHTIILSVLLPSACTGLKHSIIPLTKPSLHSPPSSSPPSLPNSALKKYLPPPWF